MPTTAGRPLPFRGHSRRKGHRRVAHGLFREDQPSLSDHQQFVCDLEAWLLVLPPGAVFTHITAARLAGWQLPALPECVPVFAAVRGSNAPRRQGLVCSRLRHDAAPGLIEGIPIDAPEEVLLRCARDLGQLDLLILLDSARRLGHVDEVRMAQMLASSRPGVARLRAAWLHSDPEAASAGETVLRAFHLALEIEVDSQVRIYDDAGQFLGRVDLLVRGTTRAHEYDGAGHRETNQHRADLRRERAWAGSRYTRSGFTLGDLVNHPAVVMDELDRVLGRSRRRVRLTRWRTLLAESLYSQRGRDRVLNRWARAMGIVEWSESAS